MEKVSVAEKFIFTAITLKSQKNSAYKETPFHHPVQLQGNSVLIS